MPSNSSLTNDRKPSLSSTSKIPPPALFFTHLSLRRYLTSNGIGVRVQGHGTAYTTDPVGGRSNNFRLLARIGRSYPPVDSSVDGMSQRRVSAVDREGGHARTKASVSTSRAGGL